MAIFASGPLHIPHEHTFLSMYDTCIFVVCVCKKTGCDVMTMFLFCERVRQCSANTYFHLLTGHNSFIKTIIHIFQFSI